MNLITYWKKDGVGGLRRIINAGLGTMMNETLDTLARNAFLSNNYAMYGGDAANTSFNDITTWADDKVASSIIDDIRLGMAERGVPFTTMPKTSFVSASPVCITSPGVIRDLINESSNTGTQNQFIDVMRYADAARIINGEIGVYRGVRFIETPRAILYNCGVITTQRAITAAVQAGDGTPPPATKVDGVRKMGQPSGVTNYIQLAAFAPGEFVVNDIVTIHLDRTAAYGVANGVDYTDGTLHNRRIVGVDATLERITLDYPIMIDFTVDLGGGVYGYVTKARHIHTALFIGGMDGVVLGVGEAPVLHTPPPVDDFDSMYRISWDAHLGYTLFEPEVFEVVFLAATNRVKGGRVQ